MNRAMGVGRARGGGGGGGGVTISTAPFCPLRSSQHHATSRTEAQHFLVLGSNAADRHVVALRSADGGAGGSGDVCSNNVGRRMMRDLRDLEFITLYKKTPVPQQRIARAEKLYRVITRSSQSILDPQRQTLICGTMVFVQYGTTRLTVSLRHSVLGRSFLSTCCLESTQRKTSAVVATRRKKIYNNLAQIRKLLVCPLKVKQSMPHKNNKSIKIY